jgi:hypothetical protein
MLNRRIFISVAAGTAASLTVARPRCARPSSYDVVVYGGSSAGVIAAVQAKRMGKSAVIVNPYSFLGGMTASGLNSADVHNPAAVSGMAREFFAGMGKAYGAQFAEAFEPHIAQKAFDKFVADSNIGVLQNERLDLQRAVVLHGKRIAAIRMESGRQIQGRMFIDASYEGDLMAKAGVSYMVGRESNAQYGETLNGFQRVEPGSLARLSDLGEADHFIKDVDPYVVRGDASSGLLPWINTTLRKNGEADFLTQAYNYRLILTDDPTNQIELAKPDRYRELDHELLLRNFEAGDERLPGRLAKIPNRKIDWNTFGAVGTDMAGASFHYAEANHETRLGIDRQHELYTRGHLWTLAHHPRVPQSIRSEMRRWGFAKDEFQRNSHFPYMLYLREGRRMVSDCVMIEPHCRKQKIVADPVALASFPMDSHVVQYTVNEQGFAEREGVFFKICAEPYGISYSSIVPRQSECPNLLVPICLSASHAAYGSIRMEPVFMSLGQVSATAASLAIDQDVAVQQICYPQLCERLMADQVMLEWNPRT